MQLAAELHDPDEAIAIRKSVRETPQDRAAMSAGNHGDKDTDVLSKLRQLGLHPAVRVFENRATAGWAQESLKRLVSRAADHRGTLRLMIGNRTA